MSNPLNSQLKDAFTNSHKVVVLSHIRPDGDSIGAMSGWLLPWKLPVKQFSD